jgi:Saxitoxin biosynthesis operon protein SxtJ
MKNNVSLRENYNDSEPVRAGADRAFGCTAGTILMVIGAVKAFLARAMQPVACSIVAAGAVLLLLGIVAPWRLSAINRLWLKIGAAMAEAFNPIVVALLFFLVVTPIAVALRIVGKRPLRLAADRGAATYWIERERASRASGMRRQF